MSILANKDTHVVILGGAAGLNAARRMAEFCYMIKQPLNVDAFVYPPDAGKTNELPYGNGLLTIPVYKSVAEATAAHPQINTSLVYIGADRACAAGMEAINNPKIQLISMITEGVPERDAKLLARHAIKLGKTFNGPSSIGIISAGACRLGVIGGAFDNLVACKLYREGSFGVITKSGGLSNEIIWICSQFADGITTAIGIGGDAYPGTDYVTYLEKFEQDQQTKAVVIVGEMGGDLEERAAEWYGAKKRRVRLLAWLVRSPPPWAREPTIAPATTRESSIAIPSTRSRTASRSRTVNTIGRLRRRAGGSGRAEHANILA